MPTSAREVASADRAELGRDGRAHSRPGLQGFLCGSRVLKDEEEFTYGNEICELQKAVQVEMIILIIICIRFIHHRGEEECEYLLSGAMNQIE